MEKIFFLFICILLMLTSIACLVIPCDLLIGIFRFQFRGLVSTIRIIKVRLVASVLLVNDRDRLQAWGLTHRMHIITVIAIVIFCGSGRVCAAVINSLAAAFRLYWLSKNAIVIDLRLI